MVIYARGDSEGTAEAARRTGKPENGEELLVQSLHLHLYLRFLHAQAAELQSLSECGFCVCAFM